MRIALPKSYRAPKEQPRRYRLNLAYPARQPVHDWSGVALFQVVCLDENQQEAARDFVLIESPRKPAWWYLRARLRQELRGKFPRSMVSQPKSMHIYWSQASSFSGKSLGATCSDSK